METDIAGKYYACSISFRIIPSAIAMNGVPSLVGVLLLASIVEGRPNSSNVELYNLTNVINLTLSNIEETIANKHIFVLFYGAG